MSLFLTLYCYECNLILYLKGIWYCIANYGNPCWNQQKMLRTDRDIQKACLCDTAGILRSCADIQPETGVLEACSEQGQETVPGTEIPESWTERELWLSVRATPEDTEVIYCCLGITQHLKCVADSLWACLLLHKASGFWLQSTLHSDPGETLHFYQHPCLFYVKERTWWKVNPHWHFWGPCHHVSPAHHARGSTRALQSVGLQQGNVLYPKSSHILFLSPSQEDRHWRRSGRCQEGLEKDLWGGCGREQTLAGASDSFKTWTFTEEQTVFHVWSRHILHTLGPLYLRELD